MIKPSAKRTILHVLSVPIYLLIGFEIYNVALLPAYVQSLKAIEVTATANVAIPKQVAETEELRQQLTTQLEAVRNIERLRAAEADGKGQEVFIAREKLTQEHEIARNSLERQRSESARAVADAGRAEAEALTADQIAANAEIKARAEADAIEAQSKINIQKVRLANEQARIAARQNEALALAAEQKAALGYRGLQLLMSGLQGFDRCRGQDLVDIINAKIAGRC